MLKLKNIKKSDLKIEADYFPEGKYSPGHIVIDVKTKAIIFAEKSPEDYCDGVDVSFYFPQAVRALKDLLTNEKIPQEFICMWY